MLQHSQIKTGRCLSHTTVKTRKGSCRVKIPQSPRDYRIAICWVVCRIFVWKSTRKWAHFNTPNFIIEVDGKNAQTPSGCRMRHIHIMRIRIHKPEGLRRRTLTLYCQFIERRVTASFHLHVCVRTLGCICLHMLVCVCDAYMRERNKRAAIFNKIDFLCPSNAYLLP